MIIRIENRKKVGYASRTIFKAMTLLFTVIAIAPGYYRFKQHRDNLPAFSRQLLHWGGGSCAVVIVYAYHSSGRIFHEEAGLIVLLILALTTYMDGVQKDRRCIFTGLFLGLITVCIAYFDSYMLQLALLETAAIAVSRYWNADAAGSGINSVWQKK